MNGDLFISNGVEQTGPYTMTELRGFVQSGHITPQSLCWREGMPAWIPISQVAPELFSSAPSTPPPLVNPQSPPPVAQPAPPPKRRSCCCSGCLIMMLLFLLLVGGIIGVAWYKYRQPSSPVDKEYKTIPDYFPPASDTSLNLRIPGGGA